MRRTSRFQRSVMKLINRKRRELKRDIGISLLGPMTWARRIKKLQQSERRKNERKKN